MNAGKMESAGKMGLEMHERRKDGERGKDGSGEA